MQYTQPCLLAYFYHHHTPVKERKERKERNGKQIKEPRPGCQIKLIEESNRQVMVLLFVSNTTVVLVLIKGASHRETGQAPDPVSAMCRPETKTQASKREKNHPLAPARSQWLRSARQCRCNSLREGSARRHDPLLVWDVRADFKGYPWSDRATAVLYEERKSKEVETKFSVYCTLG